MEDFTQLENIAKRIRVTCVKMAYDARHGHVKSALSCVDILVALYWNWLKICPDNPTDPERDRLYFSKGHGCTALYATLAARGFVDQKRLATFAKSDSIFPDHPCKHALPILETSSGSLGHALGIATGALYGLRLSGINSRAAVIMSDGECNEGSVWEAATFAAAHKLDHLLAVVDYNGWQAVGKTDEIMGFTSLEDKFISFGWSAKSINGHNFQEIVETLQKFPFENGKPSVIIAKTVSGAGISFMEDNIVWHYRKPDDKDMANTLKELKGQALY